MSTREPSPRATPPPACLGADDCTALEAAATVAALIPPTSPVAAVAPDATTPPTQHHHPPGLTMAKIQEMSVDGRLERTSCLCVQSVTVQAPVPPATIFVVNAVINGYKLSFKLTSDCLVKAAQCTCPDHTMRRMLCSIYKCEYASSAVGAHARLQCARDNCKPMK